MTRFQIRTPQNFPLESVLQQVSDDVWAKTSDLMIPEANRATVVSFFYTQIRASMAPYLKRYDLCNLFPECSDEVEGAPWLDRTDRIYLLDLPGSLDTFLEDLAFETLESTRHLYNPGTSRENFTRLQKVFRHALCRYMYSNPICRSAPVCAESKQISPWVSEEARVMAR